ncbi:MAG: hypothetical protein BJ554DRAFT_5902 [Olpidium bornovanus]|uniref:t-SNARE coiled-coil homology domain-containing protein n=1 Tax=Olpidium bornovanus TaxID=278681 RepID=A0A8H8DKF6_9FUNG|nr:MAG: hypothetical protein BJ554DRAFT_5902 [Olpidium bornovanus]
MRSLFLRVAPTFSSVNRSSQRPPPDPTPTRTSQTPPCPQPSEASPSRWPLRRKPRGGAVRKRRSIALALLDVRRPVQRPANNAARRGGLKGEPQMSSPPKRTPEKLALLAESSLATAVELVRCRNLGIPHSNQTRVLDRNLATLRKNLVDLERELSAAETGGKASSAELKQKEDAFYNLSKQVDKIEALARKPEQVVVAFAESNARSELFPSSQAGAELVRFAPLPEPGDSSFYPPGSPSLAAAKSGQVVQLQQRMLTDQDRHLDLLSESLARQREMGIMVNQELDAHATLLEDIDQSVDRTDNRLGRARKRLGKVSRKAREHGCHRTVGEGGQVAVQALAESDVTFSCSRLFQLCGRDDTLAAANTAHVRSSSRSGSRLANEALRATRLRSAGAGNVADGIATDDFVGPRPLSSRSHSSR